MAKKGNNNPDRKAIHFLANVKTFSFFLQPKIN
jgi:hypothetical protein